MAATSFLLTPIPKWLFTDVSGNPLINGTMLAFDSLDKSQFKLIFSDPGGTISYPTAGVIFDTGGMAGPFYFANDTPYFLQVFDQNGNLRFSIDNYTPPAEGGGNVSTITDINNLVINGQFFFGQSVASVVASTIYRIAPGAAQGFPAILNSIIQPYISFSANGSGATKTLTLTPFTLGDITVESSPLNFMRYSCTISGTGETYNDFVFPLAAGVKSLEQLQLYYSISARSSTTSTAEAYIVQSGGFGTNSPTTVSTLISTMSLTADFVKYSATFTIPSGAAVTVGNCGGDSVYLVLRMPLNEVATVDFVNKMVMITPTSVASIPYPYQSLDEVGARIFEDQTGDIKMCAYGLTDYTTARPGWLPLNNSSIGSAASAATFANLNTFPLYSLIWNSVLDAYAPVSSGRGASPAADFAANKTLTLMATLGRVYGQQDFATRPLGFIEGAYTHTMTIAELVAHTHSMVQLFVNGGTSGPGDVWKDQGGVANTGITGSSTPFSIVQPTTYFNSYIKL